MGESDSDHVRTHTAAAVGLGGLGEGTFMQLDVGPSLQQPLGPSGAQASPGCCEPAHHTPHPSFQNHCPPALKFQRSLTTKYDKFYHGGVAGI